MNGNHQGERASAGNLPVVVDGDVDDCGRLDGSFGWSVGWLLCPMQF